MALARLCWLTIAIPVLGIQVIHEGGLQAAMPVSAHLGQLSPCAPPHSWQRLASLLDSSVLFSFSFIL